MAVTKPTINLLQRTAELTPHPPLHPRRRRRLLKVMVGAIMLAGIFVTTTVVIPGVRLSKNFGSAGLLSQLRHLTFSRDRALAGEAEDRINVLLLGIGGAGHEAPLLTDTVMVASIAPERGRIALLSLPRDLVIPYPDGAWRKLNEIYVQGEATAPGQGGERAAETIGAVLGIPIPHFVLVDFGGFAKLVDTIGGVDVNVEQSFTDPTYPILGAEKDPNYDERYASVSFAEGWQHMDGSTALAYARSRRGNNGEGSDFARARRQQKLILALKNQILEAEVLLNPVTINRLADELSAHLETNLEPWQALRLYQQANDISAEQIIRLTLDDAPGGHLVSDINGDGAYVLRPIGGDFGRLKELARTILDNGELIQEPARVEVLNATTAPGLAAETADLLTTRGFRIVRVGNASERTTTKTVIHDYTNGMRPTSLAALRVLLGGADIAATVPPWLADPVAASVDPNVTSFREPPLSSTADFVVLLGADRLTAAPQ